MERLSNEFKDGSSTLATRVFPEKERADLGLFSTSLPVLYHEKLNFDESENRVKPFDDAFMSFSKRNIADEVNDLLEEIEPTTGGTFLPDDEEELLAGLMDDFDVSGLPTQLEDLDDDFFGSGFGMEIETENHENPSFGMPRLYATNILNVGTRSHFGFTNGFGTVSGEHPYGEHPSRTLFVRNINSNVEDSELRCLFEQYGDIRTLYTACKHRGFVMIAYYDIRAARNAMRALQNKPLRRRKLDIHFSIPKDNPSEKDINQGTLVVFNLDPSVYNDDLRQIFGAYGEVKEIRETPHKRFHKFIEYYDVRAAEAALKALNRCDIAGKRIKLEPSRPGGTRRSILQQLNHEQEHDDPRVIRRQVGSPVANSPPGSWPTYGSPVDQNLLQGYNLSPNLRGLSPVASNNLSGLASSRSSQLSTPVKIPPIGKDSARTRHLNPMIPVVGTTQASAYQPYFSVPSMKLSSSPELASSYSDSKSSSVGTLSGHQFLWGSSTVNSEQNESSAWSSSVKARPFTPRQIGAGFLNPTQHSSHVGSAPSGFPLERHLGFFAGSPETSYMKHAPFGMTNFGHSNGNWGVNIGVPSSMKTGVAFAGNFSENGSPGSRVMPISRNSPMNFGNGSFLGMGATMNDSAIDRSQIRRTDARGQVEDKKQFQLDLEKIGNGEDNRTTLMIKNIPNKYTSKMLMTVINETHEGAYDFLYLPIDFKNKCNVGYAFINMVSPAQIISFCNVFHGKKWEKFNSEKVASLAYARIQGQTALVSHFQNSSLDKDCRPIIFHSHVQQTSDLEAIFPSGDANILIHNLEDGSQAGDTLDKNNAALP